MTITEELILTTFKKIGTPNGVVKPESLSLEIRHWNKPYQEEAFGARRKLINDGYISVKRNRYVLTDKGYNHLYNEYAPIDTEKLILDEVRRRRIDVGNIIMNTWLNSLQREVESVHPDNFNNAIRNLMEKGLIDVLEMGYKLTQEGYSEAYADGRIATA